MVPGVHFLHVSMHFFHVFLSLHLPFFFSFLHFLVEILSLQLALWIVNSLSEIKTEKTSFRYYVFQDIVAKVIESVANIHSFFKIFSPCIVYYKVQLVAEPMIFKMFMKRKIDAYLLWPLAKRFQKVPKLNSSPVYCQQL